MRLAHFIGGIVHSDYQSTPYYTLKIKIKNKLFLLATVKMACENDSALFDFHNFKSFLQISYIFFSAVPLFAML